MAKLEIDKLGSKRRHKERERDRDRELGQGTTATAHGNDNWQQVSLSVTCQWVMKTGVNKRAEGWFKNMRSKGANGGNDGCRLENEIQIEFARSCSLLLCCGINLASINAMSRKLQHLLCTDARTHSASACDVCMCTLCLFLTSFGPIATNCVKWRTCDHCAATNTLCDRAVGLWADSLAEGTDKRQQRWLIRK